MGRPYLGRTHARGLDVSVLDTSAALGWEETKAALGPGDRGYPVTATDDEGWQAAATAALALSRSLPLSSMGSLGVRIAADQQELRAWANEQSANASFLVEEYLDGPEFRICNRDSRSSARDNSSGRPAICSRSRSTWPSTSVCLASNASINDGAAHSPSLSTPTPHSGLAPATVETDTTSYIPNPCESPQRGTRTRSAPILGTIGRPSLPVTGFSISPAEGSRSLPHGVQAGADRAPL
jgi:hypothetical protein